MKKNNIILIGFMGCGKTSVGHLLSRILQYHFIDTDSRIEEKEKRTIKEIFATDGESGTCLELGTGEPDAIYVLVNFDGDVRIAKGAVYSYYEFTQPISDRLTDEAWRDMVRDYTGQSMPDRPSWVSSFYTLHELHTISYTNTGTLTVHQDQFAVHYSPSMDSKITGYAKNDGYYYSLETVEAEGYSWHKIADHQWFADDGSGSAITYEAY